MSTYPQQVLVFWAEGERTVQLIVIIMPPWYFVNGLTTFDTVTLTATLISTTLQRNTEPMQLLGGVPNVISLYGVRHSGTAVTFQWTNVVLGQDGYGAITGAYILCTVTFVINSLTATGYYRLILNAQATAGDVLFVGWDQIGVSLRPGHIPLQLG